MSHEPSEKTRAEVAALAGVGTCQADISLYLDIDEKTLRKYYRRELDTSTIKLNAAVAKSLYSSAIGGNMSAAIFWLKTRAKWRETDEKETEEQQPLNVVFEVRNSVDSIEITNAKP